MRGPRWEAGHVFLHLKAVITKQLYGSTAFKVGTHTGGYSRFSFEIASAVQEGENIIAVQGGRLPRHASHAAASSDGWQTILGVG